MSFVLPELPFEKKDFKGFISVEGFDYHHGKHHAAYVNNLNAAVENTDYKSMSLEKVVKKAAEEKNMAIFNNGSQHYNHTFFWNCMKPNGGGLPTGELAKLIERDFGSFENFKKQFSDAGAKLFGSGWAYLALNKEDKLEILQFSNAGSPFVQDKKAVLTIDVWEHAYYIDHRNARPNFINLFWDFVNWDFANKQLS
jgi:Fe-Mn family superoxide dismutase